MPILAEFKSILETRYDKSFDFIVLAAAKQAKVKIEHFFFSCGCSTMGKMLVRAV